MCLVLPLVWVASKEIIAGRKPKPKILVFGMFVFGGGVVPAVWWYLQWPFLMLGRIVIDPKWLLPPPHFLLVPFLGASSSSSSLSLSPPPGAPGAACCGGGCRLPLFPPPAAMLLSGVGSDCFPFPFTWFKSDFSIVFISAKCRSLSSRASLWLTSSVPRTLISLS